MTETLDALESTNVTEAIEFIDAELGRMVSREVVTAAEVSDLLLDLRMLLAATPAVEVTA